MASVLGHTFTLTEIVGISEQASSVKGEEKDMHLEKLRSSLVNTVEEGILNESYVGFLGKNSFTSFSIKSANYSIINADSN